MKWVFGAIAAIAICFVAYATSAFISLEELVSAARAADGTRLLALTDVPRVRHSLVDQIITAYLQKIGRNRPVKPFERMAIETFGASIADELVIKLTTPDNIAALLNSGAVRDAANKIEISNMAPLARFDVSSFANVIAHVAPFKLFEFSLRLGSGQSAGSINMHFDGPRWRLSAINLPTSAVQNLVDRLPAR
jgi:hypothetical protein